jgi:hypothetical protein
LEDLDNQGDKSGTITGGKEGEDSKAHGEELGLSPINREIQDQSLGENSLDEIMNKQNDIRSQTMKRPAILISSKGDADKLISPLF